MPNELSNMTAAQAAQTSQANPVTGEHFRLNQLPFELLVEVLKHLDPKQLFSFDVNHRTRRAAAQAIAEHWSTGDALVSFFEDIRALHKVQTDNPTSSAENDVAIRAKYDRMVDIFNKYYHRTQPAILIRQQIGAWNIALKQKIQTLADSLMKVKPGNNFLAIGPAPKFLPFISDAMLAERDSSGQTLLFSTITGPSEYAQSIIKMTPLASLYDIDSMTKMSVLEFAVNVGHEAVVDALLEKGMDINDARVNGFKLISLALRHNRDKIGAKLINLLDLSKLRKSGDRSLIHEALVPPRCIDSLRALLARGMDIHHEFDDVIKVIRRQLEMQQDGCATMLINAIDTTRVDINQGAYLNRTLLMIAEDRRCKNAMQALLDKGASVAGSELEKQSHTQHKRPRIT